MDSEKLDNAADRRELERQLRARPYRAPCLRVYGAMTSLTAGGTGSAEEGSPGVSAKRP